MKIDHTHIDSWFDRLWNDSRERHNLKTDVSAVVNSLRGFSHGDDQTDLEIDLRWDECLMHYYVHTISDQLTKEVLWQRNRPM